MTRSEKVTLFLLRVSLGWLLLYAGYSKVTAIPAFSAKGYLMGAKAFTGLFHWFAQPGILPTVNFLNEWGQVLLGIALILGIGVRLSSILAVVMMVLYYLPLGFPMPDAHSFIVDEHVIYAIAFLLLAATRAGRVYGLENWCANLPICRKFPRLRNFLG